jgi:hypothetical protein
VDPPGYCRYDLLGAAAASKALFCPHHRGREAVVVVVPDLGLGSVSVLSHGLGSGREARHVSASLSPAAGGAPFGAWRGPPGIEGVGIGIGQRACVSFCVGLCYLTVTRGHNRFSDSPRAEAEPG